MRVRLTCLIVGLLLFAPSLRAYSVLTHEQVVDLAWQDSIVPFLLSQYPGLTPAQIDRAHAYAYGGCAIQDLGYYPFGHVFFSDLTHYVRSGDFVRSLFRNAHNADELAFAVGALSHYLGDTVGHSAAINPAVAAEFPGLAQKFGNTVNYAEGKHQHIQTEFAFDINQISKRHLAPLDYVNHIGLKIPQPLLDKAFFETYGLTARSILGGHRPTTLIYRFGARILIPRVAFAETLLHRHQFPADPAAPSEPGLDQYLAQQSAAATAANWDAYRRRHPAFKTRLMVVLIVITPRIGPFRDLSIRGPKPDTEQLYIDSVNRTTAALRRLLAQYDTIQARIPNRDLDTGERVRPGGYPLTDTTYAQLLNRITKNPQITIPTDLQQQILAYYADPNAPIQTKKHPAQWARVQSQLKVLATMSTRSDPPIPTITDENPSAQ